jgi:hypothetical protein
MEALEWQLGKGTASEFAKGGGTDAHRNADRIHDKD